MNRKDLIKKQIKLKTTKQKKTNIKAHQLFSEDNDSFEMNSEQIVKNLPFPTIHKDIVNKDYCDLNSKTSDNKIKILSNNIDKLRNLAALFKNLLKLKKFFLKSVIKLLTKLSLKKSIKSTI